MDEPISGSIMAFELHRIQNQYYVRTMFNGQPVTVCGDT